jgi:hypothetical protein
LETVAVSNRNIKLSLLTQWMQAIEAGYAQRGIHEIDLSGLDFYLQVGTDEMFDLYSEPSEPTPIGSLIDDLMELAKLAEGPEPFPTAVDVERLGNVLRAASEVLSK